MLQIRLQRNLLFILSGLLLFSNIWMAIAVNKDNRLVIMVPTIDKELIAGSKYISDDYLLTRGEQVIDLIFGIRHENYNYHIDQLLRQVLSKAKPEFRRQLEEFATDIKSKKYFYVFNKEGYSVDSKNLTLTFSGSLDTYLNDKRISSVKKTYRLFFLNNSGLVKLMSFEEVEDAYS